MIWQDIVLALGSLIFTIALIPSIMSSNKPALATSVLTCLVLGTVIFAYATLSLWISAGSALLNCLAWLILAIQKRQQMTQ